MLNMKLFLILLKSHPREAIKQLTEIIKSEKESRKVHLIGSSLGGYYAVHLAESLDLKAAMVNPAVWAYKILRMIEEKNLNPILMKNMSLIRNGLIVLKKYLLKLQIQKDI